MYFEESRNGSTPSYVVDWSFVRRSVDGSLASRQRILTTHRRKYVGPAFDWPKDNKYSAAKAELGREFIFGHPHFGRQFDQLRLGHSTARLFLLGSALKAWPQRSLSHQSRLLVGPVLGRPRRSLEGQAKRPMANPIEMGNTHEAIVSKLNGIAGHRVPELPIGI